MAHRLSEEEEQAFYATANEPRFADSPPELIVATLAQEGLYLASASTLYRLLRRRKALAHRRESKKPRESSTPSRLDVTGPNQVWSWDITWLKTDVAGLFNYAYTILDVFDRSLVGWAVEASESEDHAKRLFHRVFRDHGVQPRIVQADNGNPMRGVTLAVFLDSLLVSRSYSRPRCSNDNPFIESYHKTLKYSVGYPKFFTCLSHARTWYADFAQWYNSKHLHSALGYVTPLQRRTGEAEEIYALRNATLREAQEANPLRWRRGKVRSYGSLPVDVLYRPLRKAS